MRVMKPFTIVACHVRPFYSRLASSSSFSPRMLLGRIDGLEVSLCNEADYQEALDLRYNHFIKDEALTKARGGHKGRTTLLDEIGRNLLEKGRGHNLKATDPQQNDKMVALMMGSVVDRSDHKPAPMDCPDQYLQKLGPVSGAISYLYDLYGRPEYVLERYPCVKRYYAYNGLTVHRSHRGRRVGPRLTQLGMDLARDEWGCDGIFMMCTAAASQKMGRNLGFEVYKTVELDKFCVDGELLFPQAVEPLVTFHYKKLT